MEAQEIVPEAAAVSTAENLPALLDAGKRALAQASDDFERIRIADTAKAVQAAATILKRKDIASTASILVARAEREIAKHNPPKPAWDTPLEA